MELLTVVSLEGKDYQDSLQTLSQFIQDAECINLFDLSNEEIYGLRDECEKNLRLLRKVFWLVPEDDEEAADQYTIIENSFEDLLLDLEDPYYLDQFL